MIKRIKKIIIKAVALVLVLVLNIYRNLKPIPPRIYFCFNQSIHQIYHAIFVAVELSNRQQQYEVVIFSTSREASRIIEEELDSIPNRIKFVKIWHPGYNKTDFNVNWFVFLCRLKMHRPVAVIVTDFFDNVFRQLLIKTFWVYLPHGLINRKFADDPHLKDYDLVILQGKQDRQELEERIGPLKNAVVVGYSKLDYFRYHTVKAPDLFKEKKPVIMYNPHFEKALSSFFNKGAELLKALSASGKYNVIFMPHPDLARKHPQLMEPLRKLPNVTVVCRPKINLDYMARTDLYITDVSSSVFEWLYFNKPALFFNTKKVAWQNNRYYLSWVLGPVVEDVPQMLEAIDKALKHPDDFQEKRAEIFNNCFANRDQNVSKLIAKTIWQKLEIPEKGRGAD